MTYAPRLSASEYPAKSLLSISVKGLLLTGAGAGIGRVAEPWGKLTLETDGDLYQHHEKRLGHGQKPGG
jgi:hypothetical protein